VPASVASIVSMMRKAVRTALCVSDGDDCGSLRDCITNVAMAGSTVVVAASAMGIGIEYLTTLYRAYL
jgi:hypothetical protein